ncbi:bifunctional phosphopantothenoylcysteine decarboxylase/phosphopantothenate--cysteine ligase CoaBC [Dermabacteraceae bacterium P13115]
MCQVASSLHGKTVVVGVCGGIAAYKAAHVVRGLRAAGATVHVIPTPSSLEFVGRATWEALSGNPVHTGVFEAVDSVAHVNLGKQADLVLVAPATADFLARHRQGRCEDMLSAALLVATCPVAMFPAMHTEMWQHPATVENVSVLRQRGVLLPDPDSGRLTGADTGPGRLSDPEAIVAFAHAAISAKPRDLAGKRILISAGGTREALDPVRFIGNHSSGKQGFALANAAAVRGAEVTLVAANVSLPTPCGVRRIDVTSAAELAATVQRESTRHDAVVMAAAVADFAPAGAAASKIKKTPGEDAFTLNLQTTQDVLRTLVTERGQETSPIIVGFAAETGDAEKDALTFAREKARRKGADLLVANDVSRGVFGSDDNRVHILDAAGELLVSGEGSKESVSHLLLDRVSEIMNNG